VVDGARLESVRRGLLPSTSHFPFPALTLNSADLLGRPTLELPFEQSTERPVSVYSPCRWQAKWQASEGGKLRGKPKTGDTDGL